jgi:putative ABC transport system permease protein
MHAVRFVIRALRPVPLVSATAIASLALGIGANIALFSIVNAVLLRPPPYPEPDRLVLLGYTFAGASAPLVSETKLNVWKEQPAVAWQDIAALRSRRLNVSVGGQMEQLPGLQTNTDFFKLFGARAALGRVFSDADDRPGAERVVLLSDGYWKRRFGADRTIIGRPLRIDGAIATVVGVLSADVDTSIFSVVPDMWIPLQLDPNSTDHPPSLIAVARLKQGVTLAVAQGQARLTGDAFHRQFPDASGPNDTFTVEPFQQAMVQNARESLLVLVGAVALVLLVACANVANLMLIRGSVRQQEIAIRTAIGASRLRIIRQLVTEGLILAAVGGILGFALGEIAMRILLALNPADLPRIGPQGGGVTVDWRVLAFAVTISTLTGLVCSVWPAIRLASDDHLLGNESRAGATGRERRLRGFLVVGEMALALMLVVGATLLIRTFTALNRVDRGYEAHSVSAYRVALTDPRFTKTAAVDELIRTTTERVTDLPGVISAAATRTLPLESDWRTSFRIAGHESDTPTPPVVSYRIVSPNYFTTLNIPIVRGRPLADGDNPRGAPVAIINQAMARRYWANGDALGGRIIVFPGLVPDDEPVREIVGIVGNVRDGMPLDQEDRPTVYVPLAQLLDRESATQGESLAWIVRIRDDSPALARSIEREIAPTSGESTVANVISMEQLAARAIAPTTFSMTLLSVFGACALLLAATGMYGVTAYAVEQRRYEIAVRLALGARWDQIRNMVLLDGLKLASSGVVLGVAGAIALAGTLATSLYGVVPHDLLSFTTAPLVLCAAAFAAIWIPARRASRLDPAEVLRSR